MACFDQHLIFFLVFFAHSVYAGNALNPIEDRDVPRFTLEHQSSSFNLTVEPGRKVIATMCYRRSKRFQYYSTLASTEIDPSLSPSVILNIPYLLPCVCVQVYYTDIDAKRNTTCPFFAIPLGELLGQEMWKTSRVELHGNPVSSLRWLSDYCPYLWPSASLCWQHQKHVHICIPIPNSTLKMIKPKEYNLSAVDIHPQMCVQFSIEGTHHFHCPFEHGMSQWMAHFGPARQGLWVYLTSTVPASFSAQLCVQNESECIPQGETYSEKLEGGITETQIYLPLDLLNIGLCVQVWTSDPIRLGRRILCSDYTHRRWGLVPVTAMTLVVILLLLGGIVHHVAKRKVKGWLSTQRPVLLVGSSEQSTQVTAICALASILQGELCAIVHMALWAQSTAGRKDGPGPGAGVADLGPLPWLYGQWEAVCEAKGKVLIAWSPEATKYYECWRKTSGTESNKEEDVSLMDRLQGELEKGGQKRREELKLDQERCSRGHETEPSSVTGPVFRAALSHLHGALQEGSREHGIVLVYFKGLTHSRDIPKELRGVPQYCLPQDFCGLILELRESAATTRSPSCHCWTRLHSKTLSLWLARKFAGRLREKLPQAQKCSNKNKGHRLMAI